MLEDGFAWLVCLLLHFEVRHDEMPRMVFHVLVEHQQTHALVRLVLHLVFDGGLVHPLEHGSVLLYNRVGRLNDLLVESKVLVDDLLLVLLVLLRVFEVYSVEPESVFKEVA